MAYEKQTFVSGQKLMATQMNHIEDGIESLSIQIQSGILGSSDFIVEQGTSGIWTYRKWNGGIIELWGTSGSCNSDGYVIQNLPLTLINSNYTVSATPLYTSTSNPTFDVSIGKTASQITIYIRPNASVNPVAGLSAMLYIVGQWKEATDTTVSGGNLPAVDYIVEQGTSGIWTYRKWYSGIAECWGTSEQVTVNLSTAWGSLYGPASSPVIDPINFPFEFSSVPMVTYDSADTGSHLYMIAKDSGSDITTTSTPGLTALRGSSGNNVKIAANFHAIGYWKEAAATSGPVGSLAQQLFPIGYVYISTNSTSPAILFGGTWERLKDRFLLGAGDTYSAGSTGGSATHTLTTNEMPAHNHKILGAGTGDSYGLSGSGYAGAVLVNHYASTSYDTGGGAAHNNMPPYTTVYMWERTA